MNGPALFCGGRPLKLGRRVGKGGEGEVFALLDRPGEAVKLYANPDGDREAKVRAMVAAGLAARHKLIAFPLAIVNRADGRFAGFTMQLVSGHTPLFELYSPGARKIAFSGADYRFLIHAAGNTSIAVSQAHQGGAIIGDINHSGILISAKAMAALIDADSFQFGSDHLCRVGVPEYTAPELQGVRLNGVLRTRDHDAFGLAVVVFQLLFMGRHPFSGRFSGTGEMPIERAIREHRFAYSARSDTGMAPPPGAARLGDFPDEIRAMFEAAFGTSSTARPSASAWSQALRRLGSSLSQCSANTMHHFPSVAGQCIWCRMERELGLVLFVPPVPSGAAADPQNAGAASFDLTAIWAGIQGVRLPQAEQLLPVTPTLSLDPSEDAKALIASRRTQRLRGVALLISAAALLGWNPALWFIALGLAIWGGSVVRSRQPRAQMMTERYQTAETALGTAINAWRARIGLAELTRRRRDLEEAKTSYERLPGEESRRLADLKSKRREHQLQRHLAMFPLRRATIRGIGAGKIATLASYGIDTAAEIERGRILNIPGFGPVNSQGLFDWRAQVERRFLYNPLPSPQDRQEEDRVRREVSAKAAELRRLLASGASELRAAVVHIEQRQRVADPAVDRAFADFEQTKVDLSALSLPVPSMPLPVTPGAVQKAPFAHTGSSRVPTTGQFTGANACPRCGGPMVQRIARRGSRRGRPFLGCKRYPACNGTRPV